MTRPEDDATKTMGHQIDRLVAGELPDEQRRQLFAWCNAEPHRWRQCALAFLEAQSWQQGLAGWAESTVCEPAAKPAPLPAAVSMASTGNWLTLAGSIAVAFVIGMLVSDSALRPLASSTARKTDLSVSQVESTGDPIAANMVAKYVNVPVRTSLSPNAPAMLQIPVASMETTAVGATKPELPEYVRKQWEKRGYQVAASERFLSAHLPDGRDVVVPVNGVEVKFVGRPVY